MNKNRFLTFLFSLVPGVGLMYLGYMKKGLQVMLIAAAAGFLGGFFMDNRIEWVGAIFLILLPILWFYQMFDAMHTVARMKDQGIEMPADDGFVLFDGGLFQLTPARSRMLAKAAAAVLIFSGVLALLNGVVGNLYRYPRIDMQVVYYIQTTVRHQLIPGIMSLALILLGVKLLRGGKNKKPVDLLDEGGDQP